MPTRERRIAWHLDVLARTVYPIFRPGRMRRLYRELPITSDTTVLDIGGSVHLWQLAEKKGLPVPRVTILNPHAPDAAVPDRFRGIVADGCRLPFPDRAFDVAFSNSVIEHLATRDAQQRFADEVRRVARYYFVQTPNRRFFFEPHLLTPFVHWLPRPWLRRLIRNFTVLGWTVRPNSADIEMYMSTIRLLTRREFAELFPDGTLNVERFLGMPKSFVTLRSGQ